MKTIKIKELTHKNLIYLKTIWSIKTIDETIQELIESYYGELLIKENKNDKSKK